MSHITQFKNTVPLANKEWVNEALVLLQRKYQNMTIKEYPDTKYISLNEKEHGYASLTLRWNQRENKYVPQAMDAGRQKEVLQRFTDEIAVAYQQVGIQKWTQRNRFSASLQQHEGGVILNARRY